MAFWIYNATKIHLRYQFGDFGHFVRMLDRFHYGEFEDLILVYKYEDLKEIKQYYKELLRLSKKCGRLNTALDSNFRGCIADNWKTAFLLFSASLEALLTYKRGSGITDRLAKFYACIISPNKQERNNFYKKFYHLYNIRSEIMHGSLRKYARSSTNFKKVGDLAYLLRKLWIVILKDKKTIKILEDDDKQRELFFNSILKGFISPKI